MGIKHNLYRDQYHTTHQHDGASAVYAGWDANAVLICMCTEQSDAELISALLNRWTDIISMFKCIETAWRDAETGCRANQRSTMLWQLNGMLSSMHSHCVSIMNGINNTLNFGEVRIHKSRVVGAGRVSFDIDPNEHGQHCDEWCECNEEEE